jgi:hypothetical protein
MSKGGGTPKKDEVVVVQAGGFFGRAFQYHTVPDGVTVIGVCKHSADTMWFVGWRDDAGGLRRVKSSILPPHPDPVKVQSWLDSWAERRKLREVIK